MNTKLLLTRKPEWLKLKPKYFNDITFAVFQSRNIRWEKIEKKSYLWFQEIKENCHNDLLYKIIDTDFKKHVFPQQNVSVNILRSQQNFKLILFVMSYMCHKNINDAKFSYSNLQLSAYTAHRNLQKIANLMIRHLSWSYFLESWGKQNVTLMH